MSNIPGSLGYYPSDCLLLLLLRCEDSTDHGGSYALGPILRTEFDILSNTEHLMGALGEFAPDLLFAVVIGGDEAIAAGKQLDQFATQHELPLAAVWHLPELYSGARYTRVAGESADSLGPNTTGKAEWDSGVVAEIIASPSMEDFRRRGELPDLSREESLAFLAEPNVHLTEADMDSLTLQCASFAESLTRAIAASSAEEKEFMVDALLDEFQDLLDDIVHDAMTCDDLMAEGELVEEAAVYLSHTKLRDPLLQWAVSDYAQEFFNLCVAVARSTTGATRNNALCCVALSAAYLGMHYRAGQALQLAHEADSTHRLTALVLKAWQCGAMHVLFEACEEGAQLAIQALKRA